MDGKPKPCPSRRAETWLRQKSWGERSLERRLCVNAPQRASPARLARVQPFPLKAQSLLGSPLPIVAPSSPSSGPEGRAIAHKEQGFRPRRRERSP